MSHVRTELAASWVWTWIWVGGEAVWESVPGLSCWEP